MQVVRTFTGAFQANGSGGWQTIGNTEPMTIPENGYLAVYLSNASDFSGCSHCLASEGDVYFDHLEITFTKGHLKEENGYYPYGLPMAGQSSTALGMTPNRQKYQSNEYITEAGLNWMSFDARQYDPQLGRFLSVDPLAAAAGQESNSPYEAMGDEPVSETDPGGMLVSNSSNPPMENNVSLALQFAPSTLQNIFGSGSISLDDGENTSDVLDNTDWGTSGNTASAESMGIDIAGIFIDINGGGTGFSSGIAMDEGPGGDAGDDKGNGGDKGDNTTNANTVTYQKGKEKNLINNPATGDKVTLKYYISGTMGKRGLSGDNVTYFNGKEASFNSYWGPFNMEFSNDGIYTKVTIPNGLVDFSFGVQSPIVGPPSFKFGFESNGDGVEVEIRPGTIIASFLINRIIDFITESPARFVPVPARVPATP